MTAMHILPAKKFLLTLLASQTNDPLAAKRRQDDAPASPITPVAKDADQAEHVGSTCSLGASQPPALQRHVQVT